MKSDSRVSARRSGWNWCDCCSGTVDADFASPSPGKRIVCRRCSTCYTFDIEEKTGKYVLLGEPE